ncbi:MAG: DUF362 domain-containing protein [Firmicutes bacterium]|nr:DUF362 domain-containing protein [Bacillota bacterium]MDH7495316.1 DUF362 domain-containing protein [Bacillota bacterium]
MRIGGITLKTRVALGVCGSYLRDDVSQAVGSVIDLLGGAKAFLPSEGFVLVKPNMLSPYPPDRAVTTHPAVVGAVLNVLKRAGASVVVGDSPGHGSVSDVAAKCGIAAVCHEAGVDLVSLGEGVARKHPAGRVCKEFVLGRPVADVSAIINVAKMKTHGFTTFTGAVKNLFGCIAGKEKLRMHLRYNDPRTFSLVLLDLVDLVKPSLSILDAVVAMDGNGPSHGRTRHIGAILASEDPVALDVVSLRLAGVDPMRVPYLRAAREIGKRGTRPEEIEVVGARPEDFHVTDFALPPAARATSGIFTFIRAVRKHVTASPWVDAAKCVACGVCAQSCPPEAITVDSVGTAMIDRHRCIRCFCCHEMCPEGAISLRRGTLAAIADRALEWF